MGIHRLPEVPGQSRNIASDRDRGSWVITSVAPFIFDSAMSLQLKHRLTDGASPPWTAPCYRQKDYGPAACLMPPRPTPKRQGNDEFIPRCTGVPPTCPLDGILSKNMIFGNASVEDVRSR